MMKLMTLFVAMILISSSAWAELKVAVVDIQKVVQSSSAGKKARASLEEEFNKKKKVFEKKESELKKMGEEIEKKKSVLSESVLQKKQAELQEEVLKFRDSVGQSQNEIQKKQQELAGPILEKVKAAIEKMTKEKGYDLVLEKQPGIIHFSAQMDITEQIIKDIEK